MRLILSVPPGSDRNAFLQATREFLSEEFGEDGHEYVFVCHNDTNHPHAHVAIKMRSIHGRKLNPRKAYLREVREQLAEKCRKYSIDLEASPRYERGLSGKSKRSEFVQMIRHHRKPHVDQILIRRIKAKRVLDNHPESKHPSEIKALKRNQIIRKRYAERAKMLYQKGQSLSDTMQQTHYLKAAKLLERHAKTMPVEKNRGEKLNQQLDKKYNNHSDQTIEQTETLESLLQYFAVTRGRLDEQGIYNSPAEELSELMTASLIPLIMREQTKEISIEIDIKRLKNLFHMKLLFRVNLFNFISFDRGICIYDRDTSWQNTGLV